MKMKVIKNKLTGRRGTDVVAAVGEQERFRHLY